MCVFCAAAPAVMAVGTAVKGRQREQREIAEARGETPRRALLPVGKLTTVAVIGLAVAAVIYHTHQPGLV
jgi:hypothetical protein